MDMREQLYMLAIEEHGGIRRAAETLHISPPALSIFLSNLENRSGIRLFDRIGKQFLPTQAGQLYLDHARQMLAVNEHYERELQKYKEGTAGTIRFGIQPRRTLYLLAEVLTVFSQTYPEVEIIPYEENTDAMTRQLLSGELDFAILNLPKTNPALLYTPLYRDCLVAVVSREHPAVHGQMIEEGAAEALPTIDLKCFDGERFILQKPDQAIRHYSDLAIACDGAHPGQIFVLENMESAAQLAAEGYGIAFNFYQYIRNFHYKKPVFCFLTGDRSQNIEYSLVTLKGKEPTAPVLELMRLFQKMGGK